jgi:hypothetical protein
VPARHPGSIRAHVPMPGCCMHPGGQPVRRHGRSWGLTARAEHFRRGTLRPRRIGHLPRRAGFRTELLPRAILRSAGGGANMPYISKWMPAVLAIAHVMRTDGCDRSAAMHQIKAAAFDRALRWFRRDSNHWGWDAEVLRADLLKLWPDRATNGSPTKPETLRSDVEEAVDWHNRPIPERSELRRLTEALAQLRDAVTAAVRMQQRPDVPADVVEERCRQATADIRSELLALLARGEFVVFLDTGHGLERLPPGGYWLLDDGSPRPEAIRTLVSGTAPSNRHQNLAGTVMVESGEFSAFSEQYMAGRSLTDTRPQISRAPPPIKPIRGGRERTVMESNATDDRVPQWQIWKHIPELKALEKRQKAELPNS